MSNSLMKSKGNMFPGPNLYTVNPITGCEFDCFYCYLRRGKHPYPMALAFHPERLDRWGDDKGIIFIGSAGDTFGKNVPQRWIWEVLAHCKLYPLSWYLFLTKYPVRYLEFLKGCYFPPRCFLGCTLETNRTTEAISKAHLPFRRVEEMLALQLYLSGDITLMLSLEPLLRFDLDHYVSQIESIQPHHVYVGGDSKACNLEEPSSLDVMALLERLIDITQVKVKPNLYRLVRKRIRGKDKWDAWMKERGIIYPGMPIEEKAVAEEEESDPQLTFL